MAEDSQKEHPWTDWTTWLSFSSMTGPAGTEVVTLTATANTGRKARWADSEAAEKGYDGCGIQNFKVSQLEGGEGLAELKVYQPGKSPKMEYLTANEFNLGKDSGTITFKAKTNARAIEVFPSGKSGWGGNAESGSYSINEGSSQVLGRDSSQKQGEDPRQQVKKQTITIDDESDSKTYPDYYGRWEEYTITFIFSFYETDDELDDVITFTDVDSGEEIGSITVHHTT